MNWRDISTVTLERTFGVPIPKRELIEVAPYQLTAALLNTHFIRRKYPGF